MITGAPGGLTLALAADAGVRYGERSSLATARDALNTTASTFILNLLSPTGYDQQARFDPFQAIIGMGHNLIGNLRRNRHNRPPARAVQALVVQDQPYRTVTHFGGKLVRRLAPDAPSCSAVGASPKHGPIQSSLV